MSATSIAAIRRDTAAVYGLGHSEEVVRRALADILPAERPLVFTKCGLTADRSRPFAPAQHNLRPESIRREFAIAATGIAFPSARIGT